MRTRCLLTAHLAPGGKPAVSSAPRNPCVRREGPLSPAQLLSASQGLLGYELAATDASVTVAGQTDRDGHDCAVSTVERQIISKLGVTQTLCVRYRLAEKNGRVTGTGSVRLTCSTDEGSSCDYCALDCTIAAEA